MDIVKMNKQDLQIGNLVSYRGQPVRVRTVTSRKVGVLTSDGHTQLSYARLYEISPITITEEWLVKNGFEKFYEEKFLYFLMREDYTKEIDGFYVNIKLCQNTSKDRVICYVDNGDRWTIGKADIQYVHQLQNFLTILNISIKVIP